MSSCTETRMNSCKKASRVVVSQHGSDFKLFNGINGVSSDPTSGFGWVTIQSGLHVRYTVTLAAAF